MNNETVWESFQKVHSLTDIQLGQFKRYAQLLIDWNSRMNLTAITELNAIINDHFADSLAGGLLIEEYNRLHMADVGAGAGFPGVPLLIKYDQASCIFIEINGKKREFLTATSTELGLAERATVCDLDWRTFLRATTYEIDCFVARASLRPDELVRALTSKNNYSQALIAYWASQQWQPGAKESPYLQRDIAYQCGGKQRRILIFAQQKL